MQLSACQGYSGCLFSAVQKILVTSSLVSRAGFLATKARLNELAYPAPKAFCLGTVCGGVQVGDQLDRGDNELQILYMLERLQEEAKAAGGALHVLTGNHETMNAEGRFRYSTPRSTELFERWQTIEGMPAACKVSARACSPG